MPSLLNVCNHNILPKRWSSTQSRPCLGCMEGLKRLLTREHDLGERIYHMYISRTVSLSLSLLAIWVLSVVIDLFHHRVCYFIVLNVISMYRVHSHQSETYGKVLSLLGTFAPFRDVRKVLSLQNWYKYSIFNLNAAFKFLLAGKMSQF